jgi:two-component system, cell cycle sensor histidine kinase and response regulator CckA
VAVSGSEAPLRLLVVEDSADDAELVKRQLVGVAQELEVTRVDTPAAFRAALDLHRWDAVISDFSLTGFSGLAALEYLRARDRDTPFIIVSGTMSDVAAVQAIKAGANDFIGKHDLSRLGPAVARELNEAESRRQRRVLEEQLRQSQKMDAIGRLAGGVAHDFNNLLTAIIGYCQISQLHPAVDDRLRLDLNEIMQAAQRASSLTRQLLAFSRRQELEPKVMNPNFIVEGMERLLQRVIGEDIELMTDLEPALGTIVADPGQIEQVVMNLVVNAREALPSGGRITIRTTKARSDALPVPPREPVAEGDYVVLSVTDNGTGMNDETLGRIFEPFFTTKEYGTGLGLATVYGIVRQSGGGLAVESVRGQGTTVAIYLPRTADVATGPAGAGDAKEALDGTETLLVLEDDEAVRQLTDRVLSLRGYTVHSARAVEEALAIFSSHRDEIDLLIVDAVLPRMSGREFIERVRVMRPDVRALLMSGYAEDPSRAGTTWPADVPRLAKPFTPDEIARKVREALEGRGGGGRSE